MIGFLPLTMTCLLALSASSEKVTPLPALPAGLQEAADSTSGFQYFERTWQRAVKYQTKTHPKLAFRDAPKTIIAPADHVFRNFVPQDVANPLYSEQAKYVEQRTHLLEDYLVQAAVDPKDGDMSKKEGLTVKNLNGRDITFKLENDSEYTVNGLNLVGVNEIPGAIVYIVHGFLFDHFIQVRKASQALMADPNMHYRSPFASGIV